MSLAAATWLDSENFVRCLFYKEVEEEFVRGTASEKAAKDKGRSGAPRVSPWHLSVRPWGGILSESSRPRPGLESKGRKATPDWISFRGQSEMEVRQWL